MDHSSAELGSFPALLLLRGLRVPGIYMFIAVNIKIGNLIGSRRIGVQKGPGAVSTAHRCLLFDFSGCSCSLSSMSFKGICRLADNVPNGVRELRRRVSRRLQSSFGRLVLVPLRVAGGAMNIHDYDAC